MVSLSGVGSFFEPKSIAVVGVSDDDSKLASIIFANLLANKKKGALKATVYPLNPSHAFIGGQKCYPSLDSIPETPELVIVAIPASLATEVVREAAKIGTRALILITGGFAEAGREDLEREIRTEARKRGMRILGPNTIGLLDTFSGVDSLFLKSTKKLEDDGEVVSLLKPLKGGTVVITQSGHLGEIICEELAANGVGVRALVGTGNQLDVSVEDIIGYFTSDARAKLIAIYLEGILDGRGFIKAAAEAARAKPVVVFKVGRTRAGALAALTHTASLVGEYETYRAAFRKAGVVEADSLQELVDYCVTFSLLKRKSGRRLLVSTNAGGVGVIAADEAERDGLDVNRPSSGTIRAVKRSLGKASIVSSMVLSNPMDLTATVTTEAFAKATEVALASDDYDMAVVLPTHQTPAINPDISPRMAEALRRTGKPACVSVMGRADLARMVNDDFLRRGIPSFPTPERAVKSLAAFASYAPSRTFSDAHHSRSTDKASFLTGAAGPLSPGMVGLILSEYGIQQAASVLLGPKGGLDQTKGMNFPVACKLISKDLVHKSDIGGVILNVTNEEEVAAAFKRLKQVATKLGVRFEGIQVQEMVKGGVELLVGSTRDRVFGPTIVLGAGGKYAELIRDYSLAIAPLNLQDAMGLATKTRVGQLLSGYRGGPQVSLLRLARTVSRFSKILLENPSLEQIEINPLIASEEGVTAVDARAAAPRL